MLAIPSPDVLMNLFASAGQLLGLLAMCVTGGWWARRKARGGRAGGRHHGSAVPFYVSLGLLVGVSASFLLYHLHRVDLDQQRLRINLVRSSTEAGKKVGDTSLKTLDFSGQSKRGDGIETDTLAAWLQGGRRLNLVDVRESEEVEMGAIAGSWARRYPDLMEDRSGLAVDGATTVLLCESGNRSSELSKHFRDQAYDTHFMVGGYEKWKAEGRPMLGDSGHTDDLRALPEFPNKSRLLDTPEVTALFQRGEIQFVDVRYPGDFAQGHLPGAVNLTLRKMTTAEMKTELAKLERKPVVVPCYDKRSSFFALVLGLKLHRMGYEFVGRYTVPHEFTMPKPDSPWVANWQANQAQQTLFSGLQDWLAGVVKAVDAPVGNLAGTILLLALLLRLLVAPLAVKADRDRIVQQRHAGELVAIRARTAGDPVLQAREHRAFLRRHGLTHGRNVLGTMLQLFVLSAMFGAIDRAVAGSGASAFGLLLEQPDPTHVLTLLCGAALLALLIPQVSWRSWWRAGLALGFLALITWVVDGCSAATQLYLAASFALVALQGWLVRRHLRLRRVHAPDAGALVPLRAAAGRGEFGGKASRLGEMLNAGFPVPDGFVVPHGVEPADGELARMFRALGTERVAVRSSACGEDGDERSFAGEFRTLLDVDAAHLRAAIAAVRASYQGRPGGVVIQRFVPADHAGVMFTEDPAHGGRMLIESVQGLGEALVSGAATPDEYRVGRVTREFIGAEPPFDLGPLIELGQALERRFGAPQDVEWARVHGSYQLLQSRPVTARAGEGDGPVAAREEERSRLLVLTAAVGSAPDELTFVAEDHSALLPAPSPISLALMQEIWAAGSTVDLACRRLGLQFNATTDSAPYVQSVFGRCYVDVRAARGRVVTGALAAFRIGKGSRRIEADLLAWLDEFSEQARIRAAVDLTVWSTGELTAWFAATRQRFLRETYVEAEVVNLAAEAYMTEARSLIARRGGDAASLLGEGLSTVVQRAFDGLHGDASLAERCAQFIQAFGHRSPHDFELAEPRYAEADATVEELARAATGRRLVRNPTRSTPSGLLGRVVQRACRFQELKELAKHAAMHELAQLRRILVELGIRTGLQDLIFQALPAELCGLDDPARIVELRRVLVARAQRLDWLRQVDLPAQVTAANLEQIGEQRPLPALVPGQLRGKRVAGDREPRGRVVVLRDVSGIHQLQPHDILVVRHTDPCWLPAFARVAGLVTEIGGWLSHAAIQAREHNLPAVVGVTDATRMLRDGDIVVLRRDGGIERLPQLPVVENWLPEQDRQVVVAVAAPVDRVQSRLAGRRSLAS